MRTTLVSVFLLAGASIVACGSDGSPGSSGSPGSRSETGREGLKAAVMDYCQATHDNRAACSQDDVSKELSACQTYAVPCYTSVFRAEYVTGIRDCTKRQQCAARDGSTGCSCTPNEDECARDAALATPASPVGAAFGKACAAKLSACGNDSKSFTDDYCGPGTPFTDPMYGALQKCLDLACGGRTIQTCFNQAMLEASAGSCDKNKF